MSAGRWRVLGYLLRGFWPVEVRIRWTGGILRRLRQVLREIHRCHVCARLFCRESAGSMAWSTPYGPVWCCPPCRAAGSQLTPGAAGGSTTP